MIMRTGSTPLWTPQWYYHIFGIILCVVIMTLVQSADAHHHVWSNLYTVLIIIVKLEHMNITLYYMTLIIITIILILGQHLIRLHKYK